MPQKTRQFICEQLSKVSKIYCFINFRIWCIKEVWYKNWNINPASQGMLLLINREILDQSAQYFFWLFFFFKIFRATFFIEHLRWLPPTAKSFMVIARMSSKYTTAYDTSFYWKDFSSRLHLIKTNTTLNSGFIKILAWIYSLIDGKLRQILRRLVVLAYYFKTWYYYLEV